MKPGQIEERVTKSEGQKTADMDPRLSRPEKRRGGKRTGSVTRLERWLIRRLLSSLGELPLAVELSNGEMLSASPGASAVRVRLRDRATLWKMIRDPFYEFGNAYSEGRLEIDGLSLVNFLRMLEAPIAGVKRAAGVRRPWWPFGRMPRRNTAAGSRQNIHHHYDIGNDFYRLWLDEQLLYTCAYFDDPSLSLEQAQIAKMDHVCRKVWLQPGERVIEAGCGWGAFALHMARHYGVSVRAYNISREQIAYARRRAVSEGLDNRVQFILDDWRTITGHCDVFVSIGMLEHVGTENYAQLGRVIARCLSPHGRGLIHSIGQNEPRPFDQWIERHIFPGAYPPTLAQMMPVFESNGFSILDVENLRLHYAQTLACWLERFEHSRGRVAELFDEKFVRMWRLYLAGSFAAFEADRLQLYQILFSPVGRNLIPRQRRYQYAADQAPEFFPRHLEAADSTRCSSPCCSENAP